MHRQNKSSNNPDKKSISSNRQNTQTKSGENKTKNYVDVSLSKTCGSQTTTRFYLLAD